MTVFRHFAPIRAYRDLRFFLATRKRHEVGFMALSLLIVSAILFAFWKDSHFERPYKPNIIYVENWRLDRSKEEITAQQRLDMARKARDEAELERRRAKRQAEFKKVDDWLTERGL